uniref:DUF6598 domain-containing protein n=1 Tax=Aegilops tauschii subsp. strangulata TaxID=200361 RepID=A0A453DKE3_AEGTS
LTEQLKWPLSVYGVVAARDTVDCNRNLLFSRSRIRGQLLSGHDSYLRLTGPSRAILVGDYVDFEVELKVRDGDDEHNDTQLMCVSKRYKEADGDALGVRLLVLFLAVRGLCCLILLKKLLEKTK